MIRKQPINAIRLCVFAMLAVAVVGSAAQAVERFDVFEAEFTSTGQYENPYVELEAKAELRRPDGSTWTLPLFWDGDNHWKLRVSPNLTGDWSFTIQSKDEGLNGKTGSFTCDESDLRGSIEPMEDFPLHFQYQNGQSMWFLGDTAWALFTDSNEEAHDRAAAEKYLRTRAAQGFNVVHSMMLSEAGWGNSGGLPFVDLTAETINPRYWQEVDHRVEFANRQGIVVGLVIAWGDKRKQEPFAWRRFPDLEARKRYAQYIAARYGAYGVYFLVSGEWHGEVRTRPSTEAEMKREFVEIGDALAAAEPHDRMIGIHPMSGHGSVREFNDAAWMSFGDYQQNYNDLHARVLRSRRFDKPVVNSEYAYYLRDQNGDGKPDKENSTSLESIRHASWDIVMAGGYLVTGFGTTYFGGHRDPGPFNIDAAKNDAWERQIGLIQRFFTGTNWWKLEPSNEWLSSDVPRENDGKHLGRQAPPARTYWLLVEPGKQYVAYARGLNEELTLQLGPSAAGAYTVRLYNPRTGETSSIGNDMHLNENYTWSPPDSKDWVLHLISVSGNQRD
jgi:hypothetical protein